MLISESNEIFNSSDRDLFEDFIRSLIVLNKNRYNKTVINFEKKSRLNTCMYFDVCNSSYHITPYSYGNIKDLIVTFSIGSFKEKYGHLDETIYRILFKEEVLRELYRIGNINNRKKEVNKKLWNIACSLEAGSYYDFSYGLIPKMFGLPDKLSAESYYTLLERNVMKSVSFGDDQSDDSEDNENQNREELSKGDFSDNNEDPNNDSDELSFNDSDSNNSDEPDGKDSKNVKVKIEKLSNEDIDNYLRENLNDDMYKIADYESEEYAYSKVSLGSEDGIYIKKDVFQVKPNNEVFDLINKYISNFESKLTITKMHKERSFKKYSWKTDDRKGDIIYPGLKKIRSGATRVFEEAPIIFFDFSGSTSNISSELNILLYTFWKKGFICVTYNSRIKHIYKPAEVVFKESSSGGTASLVAINQYFSIENKDIEKLRNIYIITDGREIYEDLFKAYPNTSIFQMESKRKINLIKYDKKNKEIKTKIFYGKRVNKNERSRY